MLLACTRWNGPVNRAPRLPHAPARDRNRVQKAAPAGYPYAAHAERGWAELEEDGTLKGQICVQGGLEGRLHRQAVAYFFNSLLVPRFRSSHHSAARSFANFGIEGH